MRFWVLDFQCPKMEKYISISILSLEISHYGLLEEHLTVNFFLQRTSVFIRVNFFNPYSSTLAKKTVHYRPLWWPSLFNNLNIIYVQLSRKDWQRKDWHRKDWHIVRNFSKLLKVKGRLFEKFEMTLFDSSANLYMIKRI